MTVRKMTSPLFYSGRQSHNIPVGIELSAEPALIARHYASIGQSNSIRRYWWENKVSRNTVPSRIDEFVIGKYGKFVSGGAIKNVSVAI